MKKEWFEIDWNKKHNIKILPKTDVYIVDYLSLFWFPPKEISRAEKRKIKIKNIYG